ncbi:hypothetical protein N7468_009711 [Penicillium chermesinum]|uniref:Uncharacterized protein n=1 Tax=Penicillium chermesinum TaxID=63820 RepID=A0A9W9NIF8_9EURO|nr:uncharacterized protein N7468_009711 [Penicillium chermesinum]KAJ5220507.1 hypothetical protein N7468_009711 [Penicillium chermesinum]
MSLEVVTTPRAISWLCGGSRIAACGLNHGDMKYVARSIAQYLKDFRDWFLLLRGPANWGR